MRYNKVGMAFTLQIDDREHIDRKIYDQIHGREPVIIEFKRMGTGDYAVWKNGVLLLVIERKTWKDLAASIVDCRLDAQLEAMAKYKDLGVRVLLLVEGPRRAHRTISVETMEIKLDRVMLRNQIPIIYTKSEEDSARRLFGLIDNFPPELEVAQALAQVTALGGKEVVLERKEKSPELIVVDCIRQIRDVSAQSARLIMQKYTVRDLLHEKAEIKILEEMVYPSGHKLGKARATTIVNECLKMEVKAAILSGVSGVTMETGVLIVSDNKYTKESIADIIKGKRRLGPKLAERVIQILDYKK